MAAALLASKLHIPPRPRWLIPRAELKEKLSREIIHRRLAVLSCPPGYGKTTFLADWARSSNFAVAWFTIDNNDNDIRRFLRYLLAAWETVQPEIMDAPPGMLLQSQSTEIEQVLVAVVNAAFQLDEHLVFVLDDYHRISEPDVQAVMAHLLDQLPENLHFILAGQREPELPLARYRARGQLLEFGVPELSFQQEEAARFLNLLMEVELTRTQVERLQARTEGWAAGLHLAALAQRRNKQLPAQALPVSGLQRYIADYLQEEIFVSLAEEMQDFLLQTSILERLCGPLCDALTGQSNGQLMLEKLEREDLFLLPLDDRREWFRYHSLFQDFLESGLKRKYPEGKKTLHQRAARWFLDQAMPEAAFQHAVAGLDRELVNQIFEHYLIIKLVGGEVREAQRWLEALPADWLRQDPRLMLGQAGVLMVTGQFEACRNSLAEIERLAQAKVGGSDRLLARVTALRCNLACFQNDLERAQAFADQALQVLPAEDLDFRAGIYGALGDTYRRNGLWREAQAAYRRVLGYQQAPTFQVQAVHLYGALADLDLRQGQLHSAAGYWQKALAAIQQRENWGRYPLPLIGWVYIRLSELYYEWDRLEETGEYLSEGLERAELGGDVRTLIAGYVIAARLRLTQGAVEEARQFLERAQPHVERARFPYWSSRFERLQVDFWLVQGRLEAAESWMETTLNSVEASWKSEKIISHLAVARVLIADGRPEPLRQALDLLGELIPGVKDAGRMGLFIEAQALKALAHWKQGDQTAALAALEPALRRAEPEGYIRLFADLGQSMGLLLQEARSRKVFPDYVYKLLAAFGQQFPDAAASQALLTEPLTDREIEVLELLAAGLTNQEIAAALVIAAGTVKKHAGNIYNKLGVGNRTEAAARARELGLLDD